MALVIVRRLIVGSPRRSRLRERSGWVVAAVLIASMAPRTALAHGGRPQTYDVLFGADASDLVVPATFGVMSTTDAGAHWDWLCIEGMPDARRGSVRPAVRTPTDRILFAQHFGLVVGSQRDCAPAYDTSLHDRYVADVTARPGGGYAAVSSDGDVVNGLYVSETGEEPFFPVGAPFPIGFLPERVRFDPSDPMHVIVSGETQTPGGLDFTGTLFISHDLGAHWDAHDVPLEPDEHVLRALAVDPADPERLFVVAQSSTADRVIDVTAGGTTLATTLTLEATPIASDRPMVLAFASDGSVWLGNTQAGLYRIDPDGSLHTVDKFLRVACIVPHGEDLYLCGDGLDDDFALGVQRIGMDYAPTPLMQFAQIDSQRVCGTELDPMCAVWWNDLLLDTGRADMIPDAGQTDAGSDAGTDAGAVDAGPTFDASTTPAPAPSTCACGVAGRRPGGAAMVFASMLLVGLFLRRRR